MLIPSSTLERLYSDQGDLDVPEALGVGYSEGFKTGEYYTVDFVRRTFIREKQIASMFSLDLAKDDEFIRGYLSAVKNLKEKFEIKYPSL